MRATVVWSLIGASFFGCHNLSAIKPAIGGDGGADTPPASDGAPGMDVGGDRNSDSPSGTDADASGDGGGDAGAPTVLLTGVVRNYFSLDPGSFRGGAKVLITNTAPPFTSLPSRTSDGAYSISAVPSASLVDLEIDVDQSTGTPSVPSYVQTRVSTLLTEAAAQTLDVPVVTYAWMAQVAYQCGLFASLDAALQQGGFVNPYFTERSTVFGTLVNASGQPVAGVARAAISVDLGGYVNPGAGDTDPNPAKVCFLVRDATSGQYIGSANAASDATGRFVVFRLRNNIAGGPGQGLAVVHAIGYAPQSVRLRSSGNIGVVTMTVGVDTMPPAVPVFMTDVFPLFAKLGCRGCHFPPTGPGYVNSVVRGGMHLDLSGTPAQVYASLSAGGSAGCDNPATPQRLCPNAPAASLLLKKPLAEVFPEPTDHQIDGFADSNVPDYRTIFRWIQNGAAF